MADADTAPVPTDPGPLASRFSEAFTLALSSILSSCSFTAFSTCYPTPSAKVPETLRSVWTQIQTELSQKCKSEFESILMERDVVKRLNEWEALLSEAKMRMERGVSGGANAKAMHTLPPKDLLSAQVGPRLSDLQASLKAELGEMETQSALLLDEIRSSDAQIDALLTRLENRAKDVADASAILETALQNDATGAGDVKGEIEELKGTIEGEGWKL